MAVVLAFGSVAGCGLTLDYDPPSVRDAGRDAMGALDTGPTSDAGIEGDAGDVGPGPCRTAAECDDGEACNGEELCVEGACVAGEPVVCDDANQCNGLEACVDGECLTTPVVCAVDSDPCNGVEQCDPLLGCIAGTPLDCDDGIECTADSCAAPDGCVHEARDALCVDGPAGRCVLGDGCQYSVCNATTCAPGPCQTADCSGATCVRSDLCDGGTVCCAGACVPAGCADDDPCTADACGLDGCVHAPVTGPSCSDGHACTIGDQCVAGLCRGGVRLGCSDGDPCTDESCDDTSGLCVAAPNTGADCDDGNRCTAGDRCLAGLCTAGPGIAACLPLGPCWASTCDASAGCLDMPLPPGTPCGTDRACTASGICECRAGTADCDRDGTCECDGRCEATSGACVAPCVNDVDCGTGQSCCPSRGTCYPTTCLGCCMVAVGLDAG